MADMMPREGSPQRKAIRVRVAEKLEALFRAAPPVRAAVARDRALLCLDCDSIFEADGRVSCPRCASEAWAPLSTGGPSDVLVELRRRVAELEVALTEERGRTSRIWGRLGVDEN